MVNFKKEVENIKDEIIQSVQEIIRIPSVLNFDTKTNGAPFGTDIRKALDYMLELGKKDGFVVKDVDGYAGHIEYGQGEEIVGILGHLDVVPVNDGWDKNPFSGDYDGVNIYGRGASDDKGPTIAAYYAIKLIRDLGLPTSKRVRLIAGCDEESGSRCMDYYFSKEPYPNCGFTPDAAFPVIYGEKGLSQFYITGKAKNDQILEFIAGSRPNVVPGTASVYVTGKKEDYADFESFLESIKLTGSVEEENGKTKLTLNGVSAHGSTPDAGKNAITYLNEYLRTKTDNPLVAFIADYFYEDTIGQRLNIVSLGEMGPLTCNFGVLHWKDDQFEIAIDIRYPHNVNVDEMVANIEKAAHRFGFDVRSEIVKPLYVDPNSELIQTLVNAYQLYSGDTISKPYTIGGGTYAKSMPNCVAFGMDFPSSPDMHIHGNNEFLPVEELLLGTMIYAQAIYDLIK